MSRIGSYLTAALCCVLFSPALLSAKVATYWYQPHIMAKVDDASSRLQFMGPHFIPGDAYGFNPDDATIFTLDRMTENNLGLNLFFTESGVEVKSPGLLSLTTVKVPYKKERIVSLVFADIGAFEIRMNTYHPGAAPWCVVPAGINNAQNNVLCVATQKDAEQLVDALATLAVANGTNLHAPYGMMLYTVSDKELHKHPELAGYRVVHVDSGGPGEQAGVREEDILHTVNGKPCTEENLSAAVNEAAAKPHGGTIRLEIVRHSKPMTLDVNYPQWALGDVAALRQQVAVNTAQQAAAPSGGAAASREAFHLGINVRPVADADVAALALPKPMGLLVTKVEKGGIADDMEMVVGDVILQANGTDIGDMDAFGQLVRSGALKSFRVWRKGKTLDLVVSQSM